MSPPPMDNHHLLGNSRKPGEDWKTSSTLQTEDVTPSDEDTDHSGGDPERPRQATFRSALCGCCGHNNMSSSKASPDLDRTAKLFALLIALVGAGVSAAFLALGLTDARQQQQAQFNKEATDLMQDIEQEWRSYEVAGLMIHQTCRSSADHVDSYLPRGICTRQDFSELYRYLDVSGLDFEAAAWVVNATHDDRPLLEAESWAFMEEHRPNQPYLGFSEFVLDNATMSYTQVTAPEQPYYYVAHYVEPLNSTFAATFLDLDLNSVSLQGTVVRNALTRFLPSVTSRIPSGSSDMPGTDYSVILTHPGIPLVPGETADSVAALLIRIHAVLQLALMGHGPGLAAYLFDFSNGETKAQMLGGLKLYPPALDMGEHVFPVWPLDEIQFMDLKSRHSLFQQLDVWIADRIWKIAIVPSHSNAYKADTVFVILGGVVIFVACLGLSLWFYHNSRRQAAMRKAAAQGESEKAALVLQAAESAATRERNLNDFIAHEVRNPLSAAISATSFVAAELDKPTASEELGQDTEALDTVREDVSVIASSLHFINDLLRNLLEMHRSEVMPVAKLQLAPTDILRDILQPVAAILHRPREDTFDFFVECNEPNLVVMTDRMRMKQIILNLASNSRKFVEKGFIRLTADMVDGEDEDDIPMLQLTVEDSGPGVPESKRDNLFTKFQDSGDNLNQGTGIGLSLCRELSILLGGSIHLDDTFDSGVPGCPGARFVVKLEVEPIFSDGNSTHGSVHGSVHGDLEAGRLGSSHPMSSIKFVSPADPLPKTLSVLFVDDDTVLRKLFTRSIKRLAPNWTIQEAANGETCLAMVEDTSNHFDLIFVDQYMASYEKQLLGTETVRALRSKGCKACVCGLSANDTEDAFIQAGANAFMLKPFPAKQEPLALELVRVLAIKDEEYESDSMADDL